MKKLVLFDFDGVLVDTLNICYTISSEVNECMDIEEYKKFFEVNINDALRKDGSKRILNPNFHERFLDNIRKVKIPEILKVTLRDLSKKYKIFIVSSTSTETLKHVLAIEEVSQYFTELLGRDVHASKVVKTKMLLEKYNVKPTDAVFITDTTGDIKEARECEVESIAVTWGFHEEETLKKANPAKIINNPEYLLGAIEDMLK
ncbi:MAG: HAD family hydrolase [Patescibacteria group bacterium]